MSREVNVNGWVTMGQAQLGHHFDQNKKTQKGAVRCRRSRDKRGREGEIERERGGGRERVSKRGRESKGKREEES